MTSLTESPVKELIGKVQNNPFLCRTTLNISLLWNQEGFAVEFESTKPKIFHIMVGFSEVRELQSFHALRVLFPL